MKSFHSKKMYVDYVDYVDDKHNWTSLSAI